MKCNPPDIMDFIEFLKTKHRFDLFCWHPVALIEPELLCRFFQKYQVLGWNLIEKINVPIEEAI